MIDIMLLVVNGFKWYFLIPCIFCVLGLIADSKWFERFFDDGDEDEF